VSLPFRDPWEEKNVYVCTSKLPQGGEGLFARRDIKPKEVIALYNGIKVGRMEVGRDIRLEEVRALNKGKEGRTGREYSP
jgi:hypothetical protein